MRCTSRDNLVGCLTALALLGCEQPRPSVPTVRQAPAHGTTAAAPPAVAAAPLCPGGLLCESPDTMLGWRVPVGCAPEASGRRVQVCWLAATDFGRVLEFFQTRYRVEILPEGAAVHPRLAPAAAGSDAPLLHVLRRPQGVELVAMAGDGTGVTQ